MTVNTAIRLEEETAAKLKKTADKLGITTDSLIRIIFEDFLKYQDLKYNRKGDDAS